MEAGRADCMCSVTVGGLEVQGGTGGAELCTPRSLVCCPPPPLLHTKNFTAANTVWRQGRRVTAEQRGSPGHTGHTGHTGHNLISKPST